MTRPRTLILVKSVHHLNTEKVARAIAEVFAADIMSPDDAAHDAATNYDLVGFGSGIYFGRFHSTMRHWVNHAESPTAAKPAFIFSTAGLPFLGWLWHWSFRKQLSRHGYQVIGEFTCRGFDTVGPLRFVWGLNRGHPNKRDLDRAVDFAELAGRFRA